jgi:hypothetical protein
MRRFDRSAKLKDPLRLISCGHCQRLIDFMDQPAHPKPGTEPQKLHPIFVPNAPAYSVLCTCGHYTFYVNEAEREGYQAKYGASAVPITETPPASGG